MIRGLLLDAQGSEYGVLIEDLWLYVHAERIDGEEGIKIFILLRHQVELDLLAVQLDALQLHLAFGVLLDDLYGATFEQHGSLILDRLWWTNYCSWFEFIILLLQGCLDVRFQLFDLLLLHNRIDSAGSTTKPTPLWALLLQLQHLTLQDEDLHDTLRPNEEGRILHLTNDIIHLCDLVFLQHFEWFLLGSLHPGEEGAKHRLELILIILGMCDSFAFHP